MLYSAFGFVLLLYFYQIMHARASFCLRRVSKKNIFEFSGLYSHKANDYEIAEYFTKLKVDIYG